MLHAEWTGNIFENCILSRSNEMYAVRNGVNILFAQACCVSDSTCLLRRCLQEGECTIEIM